MHVPNSFDEYNDLTDHESVIGDMSITGYLFRSVESVVLSSLFVRRFSGQRAVARLS